MVDNVRLPSDGAGKRVSTNIYIDSAGDEVHTQVVSIGDRTNPNQQQSVRPDGAALVDFATGTPIFDTFGRLQMTESHLLSAYKYYEGPKVIQGRVHDKNTGGGAVAYNPAIRGYTLSTDTASGSKAVFGTDRHFPYQPASTNTFFTTVSLSDQGKTNVTRRWGVFDDNDGLFFEVNDQDIWVVIRNSITGTERKIVRTQWNGDRLDGSFGDFNRSGATLDLSKINIFTIRYQYLSAGSIIFGAFVDGRSVVLHNESNWGELNAPYMGNTYFPHRYEQENTGIPASNTEMSIFCDATTHEGYDELIRTPMSIRDTTSLATADTVPLFSLRPQQTYLGTVNRYRYLVEKLAMYSDVSAVEVGLVLNPTLTGDTWANTKLGLEYDNAATALTGGHEFGSVFVGPGRAENVDLRDLFNNFTDGLYRHFDPANTDVWTVFARKIETATTQLTASVMVLEVQ